MFLRAGRLALGGLTVAAIGGLAILVVTMPRTGVTSPSPATEPSAAVMATPPQEASVRTPVPAATPQLTQQLGEWLMVWPRGLASTPVGPPSASQRPLVLDLTPGINRFTWFGPTESLDEALRELAGKCEWVEWTAPGGFTLRYAPGQDGGPPPRLVFGSQVRISMSEAVTVPHGWFWNPDRAR